MIKISAPAREVKATLRIAGSKSISNRWLILKEVLEQEIKFTNLSDSDDTLLLKKALKQIKTHNKAELDIGHAGTDMRFLTAFLATRQGEWTINGSARMKERPISQLVNALRNLGADITYLEKENYPPLKINGKPLTGGKIQIDSGVSSQFISALLLISPLLKEGLELDLIGKTVSTPYIRMTLELLSLAGIKTIQKENRISVLPSFPEKENRLVHIESDWSSASYWYSICALSQNASIALSNFDPKSVQADSVLPKIYEGLGVKTTFKEQSIQLQSTPVLEQHFEYDFTDCPDIAQTLAITCFGLGIKASLRGLSTLKIKETDRISALKNELEKAGAKVESGNDFIIIEESGIKNQDAEKNSEARNKKREIRNKELRIKTYNDHRMAMSFAPLACRYSSLILENPEVVSKSYPRFWEDLKSVGFNVNLQA